MSLDSRPEGLQPAYPLDGDGSDSALDIVAVHGLATHSGHCWSALADTSAGGRGSRTVNWLRDEDMLPQSIPAARIFTYDYDAAFTNDTPVESLLQHARTMLAQLTELRQKENEMRRPIMFIASGIGGLLVVRAINLAASNPDRSSANFHLLASTIGIVFLACPLRGANTGSGLNWRIYVTGVMGEATSEKLVSDLEIKAVALEDEVQNFVMTIKEHWLRIPVRCFFELKKTKINRDLLPRGIADFFGSSSAKKLLVPEQSACLDGFPREALNVTHHYMNKFMGPRDLNFVIMRITLQILVADAGHLLTFRATRAETDGMIDTLPFSPFSTLIDHAKLMKEMSGQTFHSGTGQPLLRAKNPDTWLFQPPRYAWNEFDNGTINTICSNPGAHHGGPTVGPKNSHWYICTQCVPSA